MIYKVEVFAAKCDNCKKEWIDDINDFSYMGDVSTMAECLMEDSWETIETKGEEDKHYCPDCFYFNEEDEFVLRIEKQK